MQKGYNVHKNYWEDDETKINGGENKSIMTTWRESWIMDVANNHNLIKILKMQWWKLPYVKLPSSFFHVWRKKHSVGHKTRMDRHQHMDPYQQSEYTEMETDTTNWDFKISEFHDQCGQNNI